MSVTAALVKELREKSGAGMMDCKKALGETGGDMDAAIDWLRTKGLATAAKKETRSLFSFSPFNTKLLDIEGVYQISSDIEKKFAFTSMKTISSLIGVGENSYTSIEVALDGNVNKADFEKEINNLLSSDLSVLDKQDLNPALYKMLNTENLAVYLIFSLVALISMFNLVGSITIMMVEKKKDLRVIEILGGQKKDFNKIFFSLGVFLNQTSLNAFTVNLLSNLNGRYAGAEAIDFEL